MSTPSPITDSIKQQLLAQFCEEHDNAISILDADLHYLSVNRAFEVMVGYNSEFLLNRPLGVYATEFLSLRDGTVLNDMIGDLRSTGLYANNVSIANRYGQTLNCYVTYRQMTIDDQVYFIGMFRDISALVKDKEKLTHLLNFDPLTGLPKRKVFLSQANHLLLDNSSEIFIVRFNINRYRTLASSIGLTQGNNLIIEFVERVNDIKLKHLKFFAHFGSDDFVLLFDGCHKSQVSHQLDRLMQVCQQPFIVDCCSKDQLINAYHRDEIVDFNGLVDNSSFKKINIYLQLSIGISHYPKNDNQLIGLLTKAEKALQYVRESKVDDICWYHADLDRFISDSLQLEAELRVAIQKCQFVPYYQPKVNLSTGEIIGFEALVRWQHPTRGLLKPCHFIDAIIKYKLSFELFCQMAVQITKHLQAWENLGFHKNICINADAMEFSHTDFYNFLSDLFSKKLINPTQLNIEITESSLMLGHANVKKQLEQLKTLGVGLALDDFGTGYSSLSYLQEYPFDIIKIDKSFILKMVNSRTQQAIVKAILDLAIALDMVVIAEGIETEQQRDLLLNMGCLYGQGYCFSPPIPYLSATRMLTEQINFR
ncbi:EAL domain-containing protein [Psychrobacter sp. TAE2020]|uniref:putative bifunctional diguanylate cyclase/phosphodiesterase n=1 Tax=Psychrobacter sp. TAE2020 TaxID=2846762 RepID=UPI001C111D14|nr:GGDEF domain-containing phosphodiesterase [Psychrobacter sp. TAE2020]MBU5615595.1 EAL domain-containing protein [Psychrobacter sp. TAE2020]